MPVFMRDSREKIFFEVCYTVGMGHGNRELQSRYSGIIFRNFVCYTNIKRAPHSVKCV